MTMGRGLIRGIVFALINLPVAFILTLAIFPVWRWFEEISGIESFGHSGPVEWCFIATYSLCLLVAVVWKSTCKKEAPDCSGASLPHQE